jgi:glutathione synthase/RimK-type ligase-like ATP-grasp enzyme
MIAVIGPPGDQEAEAVYSRLVNRGTEACIFDLSRFPGDTSITISKDNISIGNISIGDIKAAFLRKRGVTAPYYIDYEKKQTIESAEEWQNLYSDYCQYLENERKHLAVKTAFTNLIARTALLVNPVHQNDFHRQKTYLFWHLKQKGVPLPSFMSGTARHRLKQFAEKAFRERDGVVAKPLAGIYKTYLWDLLRWETHPWKSRGALYQYYIKGDTIRCYVLQKKVIAAAVIVHGDTVDSSMSQTGIEVISLPEEARRLAVSAADALDLSFCGMDLMRESKTGEFFLIDCNMSPMFVNFARLSGIDVPAMLAEFLITGAAEKKKRNKLPFLREAKDLLAHDPEIRKKLSGR